MTKRTQPEPKNRAWTLENRRFGRWLVQPQSESRPGGRYWLCFCDCGTARYVRSTELTHGRSLSCGCGRPGRWGDIPVRKRPTLPTVCVQFRCWSVFHRRWCAWEYFGRITEIKAALLMKANNTEIEYRLKPKREKP